MFLPIRMTQPKPRLRPPRVSSSPIVVESPSLACGKSAMYLFQLLPLDDAPLRQIAQALDRLGGKRD